ncbi:MAG TPA: HupE/UreJ family protein, partial [Kofleriaceae bacterium]|nr:HupE/UreJ family protein [Kofleriaceae bacterium]
MSGAKICIAVLLAASGARSAAAHPLDIGYLRIEGRGDTVSATLDVEAGGAAALLEIEARALDAAALQARAGELADASLRRAVIETERGPCRWTTAAAALHARTASLTVEAACPSGARTLRWPLPFVGGPRVSSAFQLFVKARLAGGGEESVTTVDRSAPELVLSRGAHLGFAEFVWSGIEHIGAAPGEWHDGGGWKLPDGIDHILFLLALLLGGGTLLRLAGIATGFTAGHSITLALSGLGLVRPPPRVIEPLIALSIAWVAAQAFLGRQERHRWKTAAAFGLVHGFGFAGALQQLELSTPELVQALFGYNAGVELGQLAIVLAIAPGVLLLQRRPRLQRIAVRGLAAVIFIAGGYWFVERLVG